MWCVWKCGVPKSIMSFWLPSSFTYIYLLLKGFVQCPLWINQPMGKPDISDPNHPIWSKKVGPRALLPTRCDRWKAASSSWRRCGAGGPGPWFWMDFCWLWTIRTSEFRFSMVEICWNGLVYTQCQWVSNSVNMIQLCYDTVYPQYHVCVSSLRRKQLQHQQLLDHLG